MNDIKVNQNITVTIKGQTFVLSSEEAKDLLNKLKSAGVNDYVPIYPINPWPWLPPYDTGNPPPYKIPLTWCNSSTNEA